MVGCARTGQLTTEKWNRCPAQEGAIDLFALLLEGDLAQTEELAMQNGKGMKEREGDLAATAQ